jgi:hypothetical protein
VRVHERGSSTLVKIPARPLWAPVMDKMLSDGTFQELYLQRLRDELVRGRDIRGRFTSLR